MIHRTRMGSDAFYVDSDVLHLVLLFLLLPSHIRRSICGREDARETRSQIKPNHHGRSLATQRDHESGMCMCMCMCMCV